MYCLRPSGAWPQPSNQLLVEPPLLNDGTLLLLCDLHTPIAVINITVFFCLETPKGSVKWNPPTPTLTPWEKQTKHANILLNASVRLVYCVNRKKNKNWKRKNSHILLKHQLIACIAWCVVGAAVAYAVIYTHTGLLGTCWSTRTPASPASARNQYSRSPHSLFYGRSSWALSCENEDSVALQVHQWKKKIQSKNSPRSPSLPCKQLI